MVVVFLGAPGAGKGTQAARLADVMGARHLSTGELFRSAVAADTELGREVARYVDRGMLVPDETVLKLVADWFGQHAGEDVILDGFPRTLPQAHGLARVLSQLGRSVDHVIHLEVDEPELVRRLRARGRRDDQEETIARRLEVYRRDTEPLIEHYRKDGALVAIDGKGTPEEVFEKIRGAVLGTTA